MTAPGRRPRIGITAWCRELQTHIGPTPLHAVTTWFVTAIESVGGVPLVLPAVERGLVPEVLDILDGLLVTGGQDLDPGQYGQVPHPKTQTPDPRRDAFEIDAVLDADRRGLPMLCVCRGIQVLNVARGGTLIQDVPSQVPGGQEHSRPDAFFEHVHPVTLEPASRTAAVFGGPSMMVNTSHHQAVDALGTSLRAVGWAPEGFVEAVEDDRPDRFVIGVQWHPESLFERFPEQLAPFRALVAAAAREIDRTPVG